jgi:hypothetical protein
MCNVSMGCPLRGVPNNLWAMGFYGLSSQGCTKQPMSILYFDATKDLLFNLLITVLWWIKYEKKLINAFVSLPFVGTSLIPRLSAYHCEAVKKGEVRCGGGIGLRWIIRQRENAGGFRVRVGEWNWAIQRRSRVTYSYTHIWWLVEKTV